MQKIKDIISKIWANPLARTVIVAFGGGAGGAVYSAIQAGTFALNAAMGHTAIVAGLAAVTGLHINVPAWIASAVSKQDLSADDAATSVPPAKKE